MEFIEIGILIAWILASWLMSFLVHEWGHIKSQGLFMTGAIDVKKFSFTAIADQVKNAFIFMVSGGVIAGIIFIILGLTAVFYGAWAIYVPTITLGVINFVYGLWEGFHGADGRYIVYAITTLFMIIFWIIHYFIFMV